MRARSLLSTLSSWPTRWRALAGVVVLVSLLHAGLIVQPAWQWLALDVLGQPNAVRPLTITRMERAALPPTSPAPTKPVEPVAPAPQPPDVPTPATPVAPPRDTQSDTAPAASAQQPEAPRPLAVPVSPPLPVLHDARLADAPAVLAPSTRPNQASAPVGDVGQVLSPREADLYASLLAARLAQERRHAPEAPPPLPSPLAEPLAPLALPPPPPGPAPLRAISDQPHVPDDLPAPPHYPVRLPAHFALDFQVERGDSLGRGRLLWETDGANYLLTQTWRNPGRPEMGWVSRGWIDAHGLAPLRMLDQRNGRDVHAVNFQRDKGLVSYSDVSLTAPLAPGVQDRASWLIQLAGILQARQGRMEPGETLTLQVASPRGQLDTWLFKVHPSALIELPGRTSRAVYLLREASRPYDTRVEVWLVPQWHFMPLRMRWVVQPAGDVTEWWLDLASAPEQIDSLPDAPASPLPTPGLAPAGR